MYINPRLKLISVDPEKTDEISLDTFPDLVIPDLGTDLQKFLLWMKGQPDVLKIDPQVYSRNLIKNHDPKTLARGKKVIMEFRDLLTQTFGGGYDTLAVYWSRDYIPGFTRSILEHDLIARCRNHGVRIVRSLDDYFEELHWRFAEDVRTQVSQGPRCKILLDISVSYVETIPDCNRKRLDRATAFVPILRNVLERECHEVVMSPEEDVDTWVHVHYPNIEIRYADQKEDAE